MWNDPIVEEVRRVRQAHAKKFNYDIKAIVEDLRKQQSQSGKKYLVLRGRKPTVFPKTRAGKEK